MYIYTYIYICIYVCVMIICVHVRTYVVVSVLLVSSVFLFIKGATKFFFKNHITYFRRYCKYPGLCRWPSLGYQTQLIERITKQIKSGMFPNKQLLLNFA